MSLDPFKSWGIRYDPSIPHAPDFSCPHCNGWSFLGSPEKFKQTVGFSLEDLVGKGRFGVVIIECPLCFEKCWAHVSSEVLADTYRDLCQNWPKRNKS